MCSDALLNVGVWGLLVGGIFIKRLALGKKRSLSISNRNDLAWDAIDLCIPTTIASQ